MKVCPRSRVTWSPATPVVIVCQCAGVAFPRTDSQHRQPSLALGCKIRIGGCDESLEHRSGLVERDLAQRKGCQPGERHAGVPVRGQAQDLSYVWAAASKRPCDVFSPASSIPAAAAASTSGPLSTCSYREAAWYVSPASVRRCAFRSVRQ